MTLVLACMAYWDAQRSNHDLNILDHSPFFQDLLNDRTAMVSFIINNKEYIMGYYLVDGIYPE